MYTQQDVVSNGRNRNPFGGKFVEALEGRAFLSASGAGVKPALVATESLHGEFIEKSPSVSTVAAKVSLTQSDAVDFTGTMSATGFRTYFVAGKSAVNGTVTFKIDKTETGSRVGTFSGTVRNGGELIGKLAFTVGSESVSGSLHLAGAGGLIPTPTPGATVGTPTGAKPGTGTTTGDTTPIGAIGTGTTAGGSIGAGDTGAGDTGAGDTSVGGISTSGSSGLIGIVDGSSSFVPGAVNASGVVSAGVHIGGTGATGTNLLGGIGRGISDLLPGAGNGISDTAAGTGSGIVDTLPGAGNGINDTSGGTGNGISDTAAGTGSGITDTSFVTIAPVINLFSNTPILISD